MNFSQKDDMYKLTQYDKWKKIVLTVYHVETDAVREVTIRPGENWGYESEW